MGAERGDVAMCIGAMLEAAGRAHPKVAPFLLTKARQVQSARRGSYGTWFLDAIDHIDAGDSASIVVDR